MGEEGGVMLLLAGDLGCDLRVGRTFRTPQYIYIYIYIVPTWVVFKIMVPFWVPQILGAVL